MRVTTIGFGNHPTHNRAVCHSSSLTTRGIPTGEHRFWIFGPGGRAWVRRHGRRRQLSTQSTKRAQRHLIKSSGSIIPEYSYRCPIITVESGNVDQTDEARAKRARPAKWARVQSPHKVKKTVVKQIDPERFEPSGPISQGDPQALISKTRLIPTVPLWHGVTTFWPKETRRAPLCPLRALS